MSQAVLRWTEELGPRTGPLITAALLFAPSLVVLAMTGPVAIRHATKQLEGTGRSSGSVYAVSTAGSVVGTLILVYLLIPNFEANSIVTGTAALLVLLGAVSLVWRGWPIALLALLLPALTVLEVGAEMPEGFAILDRSHSLYGLVEVIDDRQRGVRFLRSDHSILGARFARDGSSGFAFVHVLEAVRFLRPQARTALQVGLGVGSLPNVLASDGIKFDAIEIDPAVARFAEEYFGYHPSGAVFVEDARTYLRHAQRQYDIIVHDTFTGGTTPEHLLSLEVVQRVRSLLHPGGVLALNFIGYHEGSEAEASFAVARTLKVAFQNLRVFRDAPLDEHRENPGNR